MDCESSGVKTKWSYTSVMIRLSSDVLNKKNQYYPWNKMRRSWITHETKFIGNVDVSNLCP